MNGTRGKWLAGIAFLLLTTLAMGADDCALGKVVGVKRTLKSKPNILAESGTDYGDASKDKEPPAEALDGNLDTKYYNQARSGTRIPGIHSGLVVTLKGTPQAVTGIQFATANDVPGRDPLKITVEGSNDAKALNAGCSAFTLLYEGESGLETDPGRKKWGKDITFTNSTAYVSYRILITSLRDETGQDTTVDSTQYAEVRLLTATTKAATNIAERRRRPAQTATDKTTEATPTPTPAPTEKSTATPKPTTVKKTPAVTSTPVADDKSTYLALKGATKVKTGFGKAGDNLNVNGNALCVGKQVFDKGIGLTANSEITFKLNPDTRWVTFYAGVDSELVDSGALRVNVYADDQVVYESSTLRFGEDPIYVSREIKKKDTKELRIVVVVASDGTANDILDLGNLRFSTSTTEPTRDAAAAVKE